LAFPPAIAPGTGVRIALAADLDRASRLKTGALAAAALASTFKSDKATPSKTNPTTAMMNFFMSPKPPRKFSGPCALDPTMNIAQFQLGVKYPSWLRSELRKAAAT